MKLEWLILYDIAHPKRLRKVSKILEEEGIRVQKSLFECIGTEGYAKSILYRILKVVDEEEDYVLLFPRCSDDLQRTIKVGKGSNIVLSDKPYKLL